MLVEAGFRVTMVESDHGKPVNRTPAEYLVQFATADDWNFQTTPQPHLGGRRLRFPRGRGLGGSTRINAMIWYPSIADLQRLSIVGGDDWPIESLAAAQDMVTRWVQPESPRWVSTATNRFLRAVNSLHHPLAGPMFPFQRMTRRSVRVTAWDVLAESQNFNRLSLVRGDTERVLFDSCRAAGIELARLPGQSRTTKLGARHGIILATGSIATPAILMRSGIGPEDVLREEKIDPMVVNAFVGAGLQDHLIMPIVFAIDNASRFPSVQIMHDLARFRIAATGPLSSNLAECGGIISAMTSSPVQVHVTPTHYLLHPHPRAPAAMTIGVNLCQPHSRGHVRIRNQTIEIDPSYLSDSRDLDALVQAVTWVRGLVSQSSLATFVNRELIPGRDKDFAASIARSIRRYAHTLYHPTSTCAMGVANQSVVNNQLAVRGVSGLSIVDASILPAITTVNPNATIMTLALHAANLLKRRL